MKKVVSNGRKVDSKKKKEDEEWEQQEGRGV